MAYILIDGYNLIGIVHWNLEKARNDLVQRLYEYAQIKGHDVTVVFDGWKDGKLNESRTKIGKVTVIYSKLGEKADSVIKKIISAAAQPLIVVSSDREISDFAEKKESVVVTAVTSDEFERKLSSAHNVYGDDGTEVPSAYDKDDDIDLMPFRQKGNPRKLSKKEKKKVEALKKL
ncbi:MAG: NYN domain-containing protein [Nitrospirae bacterium]|nr:NYN domain-containing protein [Nitrospirota bacterium]